MKYAFLFLLFIAALTVAFPSVDLLIAGWFYESDKGFFLKNFWFFQFLYEVVPLIVAVLVISLAGLFLWEVISKKTLLGLDKPKIAFLFLALVMGPGVVVNMVLKEHMGRARPSQVIEFGGVKHFTPALTFSRECERNCSFVAGHPSVGFFFFSFLWVYEKRRYSIALGAGLFGALLGLARIAQGGHFFSDVLFSAIFTIATAYILQKGISRLLKLEFRIQNRSI